MRPSKERFYRAPNKMVNVYCAFLAISAEMELSKKSNKDEEINEM